ncbi:hypothetical protein JCM33374_g4703 [Metschnikowia sp. JCM 33374]|nr:hypothetical protein JCM33374_g4703 [Metschnikowia sp. JCM 33374]
MTPVFLLTLIFGPGLVYASWIAKRGPIEHDHTYASDIPEPATFEDCFGGCFDEKYPGYRERNLAGTARAPVGVLGANPGEHPGYLQPMDHDFCASNPHDTGEEQVSILRCLEKFVDRVFHPSESEGQPQGDIERFQESGVFGSGVFGSGVFGAIEDFQTDELGFTEYPDFSDFIYEPVRFPEDDIWISPGISRPYMRTWSLGRFFQMMSMRVMMTSTPRPSTRSPKKTRW